MKNKKIITDDLDLQNKDGFTYDSFFSKENKGISNDSAGVPKMYSGKNRFFALLSTSDKEINNRLYDKASWKKTVTDGTWQGVPYAKPMLRNHNLYSGTPFGRIKDSFFVDHDDMTVVNKDNRSIDQSVIDHFKNNGAFNVGTGTVIVEFTADEVSAERINAGLDVTVSQSSFFGKATCSVCNQDYFGGACNHYAGGTYEVEDSNKVKRNVKCLVKTEDFEPVELSIVNIPANDVSSIFVLSPQTGAGSDNSGKEPIIDNTKNDDKEPKIDDNKIPCNNGNNEEKIKAEDMMFKNLLKDTLKDKIVKEISDTPELAEKFNAVFDSLETEDQVKTMKDFVDQLVGIAIENKTAKIDDSKSGEVAPETVIPETGKTEDGKTEDGKTEDGKTGNSEEDKTKKANDEEEIRKQTQDLLGSNEHKVEKQVPVQTKTHDSKEIKAVISSIKL